jgi:hypothetical protein
MFMHSVKQVATYRSRASNSIGRRREKNGNPRIRSFETPRGYLVLIDVIQLQEKQLSEKIGHECSVR